MHWDCEVGKSTGLGLWSREKYWACRVGKSTGPVE